MTDHAIKLVMQIYEIDEETAVRLYKDEIEAAERLLTKFEKESNDKQDLNISKFKDVIVKIGG